MILGCNHETHETDLIRSLIYFILQFHDDFYRKLLLIKFAPRAAEPLILYQ
jgi:hypothetical protein